MSTIRTSAIFVALTFLLLSFTARAQSLQTTLDGPAENLINEEVCYSLSLHNEGITGYQPYLRVFLPPQIPANSISAEFMGQPISAVTIVGTFNNNSLNDPNLPVDDPNRQVTGTNGTSYVNINIPVGALVTEGVEIAVTICAMLNGPGVALNTPVAIQVQPLYRYGNTPTGENGSILFSPLQSSVTPIAYKAAFSADPSDIAGGSCNLIEYKLNVDIGNQQLVNNLNVSALLPPGVQYAQLLTTTPGCVIQQQPAIGNSGTFALQCNNVMGSSSPTDVTASFLASTALGPDPQSCDSLALVTNFGVTSNQVAPQSGSSNLNVYHLTLDPVVETEVIAPGETVTLGVDFNLSELIDGLDNLVFDFVLPDGLTYLGGATLDGDLIAAGAITSTGDGETELQFDVTQVNGALSGCVIGQLTFNAQINTLYSNGQPLIAGDRLQTQATASYNIINGTACVRPFTASVTLPKPETMKEVVSTPQNGTNYVAGESVTYRLTLTNEGAPVSNLIFEDFFPIPIHDVSELNLNFGEAIVHAPTDNQGLNPQNISINAARNSLIIAWGDIPASSPGSPAVVSVDVSIPISIEPFAPGLIHTNFARFNSENSEASISTDVSYVSIQVGAPMLTLQKGVLQTNNPFATLSPITTPVNANAQNVDAYDWVTFRTTLTNIGDAAAYDVITNYFPETNYINQCSVVSVQNVAGNSVPYSGNLFGAGLVIETIPRQLVGSNQNRVHVNYQCQLRNTVESRLYLTNESQATWASVPGGVDLFTPVSNQCFLTVAKPEITTNVIDIQPGYATNGNVHIGELVTFETLIRVPEGRTSNSVFEFDLPEGMSVEQLISLEADFQSNMSGGSPSSILNNAVISNIGSGLSNHRRRVTLNFGTIQNLNSNNLEAEFIRFVFSAVVLNAEINQSGHVLNSVNRIRYTNPNTGSTVNDIGSSTLTVVEPDLDVSLSFFESALLPSGQTFVTVTVAHQPTSTATAYNVNLVNDLPLGLQLVPGSFIIECEDLFATPPQYSAGAITAHWDSIPQGTVCEFVYTVQVIEGFPPCTEAENCTELQYASAHAAHLAEIVYGPVNPIGVRRSGNINAPGGALNDYRDNSCGSVEVVIPNLNTPQISGNTLVCQGSTVNLSVQQYDGVFVEYVWTKDGEVLQNNSHQLNVPNALAGQSGVYTASVQIGACATPVSQPFELTVIPNPTANIEDHAFPCASGFENIQITPEVSGGGGNYTYSWAGPNFVSSQPVATILNATESNSGVYSLVVTDQHGCSSTAASGLVTISAAPPVPVIQSGASACEGESFMLSTSAYPGAQSYHWETPIGEVITAAPNLTLNNATGDYSGEYTVWVQMSECASAPSFAVQVTVNANPALPVINISETNFCAGETLVLSTGSQAQNYSWTGPNGFTSTSATPSAIEPLTLLSAGTYQLMVSNGNCVSPTATVTVEVNPLPPVPGVQHNSPICQGETIDLSTTATAQTYDWGLPNGGSELTNNGVLTLNSATASQGGNYTLSVFDGTCWSNDAQVQVVVDVIPAEQAYAGANVIACLDGGAMLQAVNDPSLQGAWSTPGNDLTFGSPSSQVTAVSGMIQGEMYLAEWSLFNAGCGVYSSDEVTVFAPFEPEARADYYELVEGEQTVFEVTENDEPGPVNYTLSIITPANHGATQIIEGNQVRYRPEDSFSGEDEFVYRMCLTACPDMCDTALVKIKVFPYLRIPDIVTPNGDGVNDVLVIEGINRFPSNELHIFNRWGREVYSAENYNNDWDATWQGKPLPNGTYFYVLNNRATGESLGKGYITVHQ